MLGSVRTGSIMGAQTVPRAELSGAAAAAQLYIQLLTSGVSLPAHLAFDASEVTVPLLHPYRFDTGLTPVGSLVDGPIEVVNVMARRANWDILACLVTDRVDVARAPGDLVFVFALTGDVPLRVGSEAITLALQDVVIAKGAGDVRLEANGRHKVLFAHLRPTAD